MREELHSLEAWRRAAQQSQARSDQRRYGGPSRGRWWLAGALVVTLLCLAIVAIWELAL